MHWEVRDETGVVVGTEGCPGNAAELEMVLSEMNPDKTFIIVEVDETGTPRRFLARR